METEQSASSNEKSDEEMAKGNEERKGKNRERNREYQRAWRRRQKDLKKKILKEEKEEKKGKRGKFGIAPAEKNRERNREYQRAWRRRQKDLKKKNLKEEKEEKKGKRGKFGIAPAEKNRERNREYQRAWRRRQKDLKKKILKEEKEEKKGKREIDISNVEPQIKEECEDPEDNLEIKIPSLKLNMEMEHGDEIKEEITIEENNFQCRICLSVGRRMSPLEEYKEIYKKLLFDNYQDQEENWFSTVQVCWECHALLRSVDRFQRKVRTAHHMLQSQQNDVSLSTLTTVVFSDSNPANIYLIETDKQTDQLNSETDTDDNTEDNELLIDRKIVKREPKFKVIDGVEIFKRVDFDLNDLREVLDERRNEESYKRSGFRCSTCILSFDDENELDEHNRECHDEKIGPHVCEICQCRFSERVQLVSHSRSHFSEFYCRLCSYRCSSEVNRDRHWRPTECLECGQLFRNHRKFKDHYKKSHETFACDHCGLVFKIKLCLVKHISKKHMKLESKICDKTFSRYNSLWLPNKKFHIPPSESSYHANSVQQKPERTVRRIPPKSNLNNACSREARPKLVERAHESVEENATGNAAQRIRTAEHFFRNTELPCPECGKGFTMKSSLKSHYELFHLKQTKFKCVDCDKYFGRNTGLTRHRLQFHDKVLPPKN